MPKLSDEKIDEKATERGKLQIEQAAEKEYARRTGKTVTQKKYFIMGGTR